MPLPVEHTSLVNLQNNGDIEGAFRFCKAITRQGTLLPADIIHNLLLACNTVKCDISRICKIHALIASIGLISSACSTFGDHLIRLFGSSGNLLEADKVFHAISKPNVVTWNAIISTHSKFGRADTAICLYRTMIEENVEPDKHIYCCIIKACCSKRAIQEARIIHSQITENLTGMELVLYNSLIDMYAKCGKLEDSRNIFEALENRDIVSWGAMMSAYIHHRECPLSLHLFFRMQSEGFAASKVTILLAVKACADILELYCGRIIHHQIIEARYELDILIVSTLIHMYAQCGFLDDAYFVFEKLTNRNVVSWSSLISGYVQHGQNILALRLLERMYEDGIKPSNVTFLSALQACGNVRNLDSGMILHNQIIITGLHVDMVLGSSLLDMYAKCGKVDEAQKVFDSLPKHDIVSWGAIICGHSQHGQGIHALELYSKMQHEKIECNKVIYLSVLKACGSIKALEAGQSIHDEIIKNEFCSDTMIISSLIDMYGKCGRLKEAHEMFSRLSHPDVISWGALISGYAQKEQGAIALQLFDQMQRCQVILDKYIFSCVLKACGSIGATSEGRKIYNQVLHSGFEGDIIIGNALIDMFAKCGSLTEAHTIFDNMENRDEVSWGTIIAGYVQHGLGSSALEMFGSMCKALMKPDKVIFVSMLMACSDIQATTIGRILHYHILVSGIELDDVIGYNVLNMYVKCGEILEARKVFDEWPELNVVSYDVMISGYVELGLNAGALELFEQMQNNDKLAPNKAIFSSLLKACANTGDVYQGRLVHDLIVKSILDSDVAIGSTLIDMYAKCGNLYEAYQVLNGLTYKNVVSWGALISGYAQHGNFPLVRQCLSDMEQHGTVPNDAIFLNILTACSHTAMLEDGLHFFKSMMADYGIPQGIEHYNSMVDIFGRAGCLKSASDLLETMPLLPNNVVCSSLLVNSKTHGNVQLGNDSFQKLHILNPIDASGYVLLSNIYADADMCKEVHRIQTLPYCAGAHKKPGKAWIEIGCEMHEFTVVSALCDDLIQNRLRSLSLGLKEAGYFPQLDTVLNVHPQHTAETEMSEVQQSGNS